MASALAGNAINALAVNFLRAEFQSKLLSHYACKEAAHRVLLPTGQFHHGCDGRAGRRAKHLDDPILFRALPDLFLSRAGQLRLDWQWRFGSNRSC
jgi:hypothetical protein